MSALVRSPAIVLAIGGVLLFTRYLIRPIEQLTEGATRMAGGDLTAPSRSGWTNSWRR